MRTLANTYSGAWPASTSPLAIANVAVKLRIDADALAVLKAAGPGRQTRANHILGERFAL